jgi:hypothetical protein
MPWSWRADLVELSSLIAELCPSATLYLTGSRAIGVDRPNSDVDLVLALPDGLPASTLDGMSRRLASYFGHRANDPEFLLSVPKIASWADIKSCYGYEAASFGLQFWNLAELVVGLERRTGSLASEVVIRRSAARAAGRWLSATLYRLSESGSRGVLTAPLGTIGRAARALALLRSGIWEPSYSKAFEACTDRADTTLPMFRQRADGADTDGLVDAPAAEWVDVIEELSMKLLSCVPGDGSADRMRHGEQWLYLDRPVPITTRWKVVGSSADLERHLLSEPSKPAITARLAALATPDAFSADAYLAYFRFNRYNKWIDGTLAEDDRRWAAFADRATESLERVRRIFVARHITTDRLDLLLGMLSRSRKVPPVAQREQCLDEWLRLAAGAA